MYEPDTILVLKELRSTEDKPFAYDRVKVVGTSPVNHASSGRSEWSGGDSQGVIIQPLTDFGATLDEPFGKLQVLYEVESVPEHEIPRAAPVRVINSSTNSAGPTPEQVFKEQAPGKPSKAGERVRSPLDGLVPEQEIPQSSPLGDNVTREDADE